MIKRTIALAAAASVVACPAADFTSLGSLSQEEFAALSRDLGAALSYKGVTPATPLGATGFDIGVEATDTRMQSSSAFQSAGAGSHSDLAVAKLHVYKGLFGGLDIGAFAGAASQVSASVFGADLRYALVDDGLASPAVAVRLSGTKATGMGDLGISTAAVDLMASKKLTLFTPYAGAGVVRVMSRASGTGLADERFDKGRVFGGLNVNLVGANVAVEVEKMGSNTSLSAKVGLRF
ncbi:MAG: hypothetical protein ACXWG1_05700 [Usitatibacter sp.]